MCNDFGNHIPYDDYLRAFSQTRTPVRLPASQSFCLLPFAFQFLLAIALLAQALILPTIT